MSYLGVHLRGLTLGDLDRTKTLAGAIRDPWFIVDPDRNIVDYNEAFLALVGDASPEGRRCYELLELSMCRDDCIALQAMKQGGPARRDDVPGRVAGAAGDAVVTGSELLLRAGAAPLTDLEELPAGALVVYQDVTSAGRDRQGLQDSLEQESAARHELQRSLRERTRELLAVHDDARRLEEQLAAIRKGIVEPDP